MKAVILYITLGLLTALETAAQDPYQKNMKEAFDLWKADQPDQAANLFERIAQAEKDNWLPYYYASQVKIVQSFPVSDTGAKENMIEKAQVLLDQAKALSGDEAELLVLQALLHTARLTIDPATYGRELSPVINQLYARALQLAPENPRVILSKAEWDMGAAQFFGKDPAAYCSDIQRSLDLFKEEMHGPLIAPAWGQDRAQSILKSNCPGQ